MGVVTDLTGLKDLKDLFPMPAPASHGQAFSKQLRNHSLSPTSLEVLKKNCNAIAKAEPGNVQHITSLLQRMIVNYYGDVRRQAQQSFYSALGAAFLGTALFVYGEWLAMRPGDAGKSVNISLVAGALVQVISGINFYLYAKASRQFGAFHICLERTNRFLLAHNFCENLKAEAKKDQLRAELVCIVANAPMLTMDIISGDESLTAGAMNSAAKSGASPADRGDANQ
jgi:hypothetical protein